jgi:hypothetical protein
VTAARVEEVRVEPAAPVTPASPLPLCPACGRALPGAAADGPARALLEALGLAPDGATTRVLARTVRRRERVVFEELSRLAETGLVERVAVARGRAWNARPWRLVARAPGAAPEQRQGLAEPLHDDPAVAILSALLAAACTAPARVERVLAAAALALCLVPGLLVETEVA